MGFSRPKGGLVRRDEVTDRLSFSARFAVVGIVVILAYLLAPSWSVRAGILVSLGILTIAVLPWGSRLNRPPRSTPWLAFTISVAFICAGGALAVSDRTLGNITSSRGEIPDIFTFVGYLTLGVGATLLVKSPRPRDRQNSDLVLKAVLVALGALSITWAYIVMPRLAHGTAAFATLVIVSRPVIDAYALAMIVLGIEVPSRRSISGRALVCTLGALAVGDLIYQSTEVHLTHINPQVPGVAYMIAATFLGVAALHPTMRRLSKRYRPLVAPRQAGGRLAFIMVSPAVPIVIIMTRHSLDTVQRLGLAVVALAALVAASVRTWRALSSSVALETRLSFQLTHDPLTGLANRAQVDEWWANAMSGSPMPRFQVAAVLIDIDRFKLVNDTHGSAYADALLVQVAGRLRLALSDAGLIARIGGDQFLVLIPGVDGVDQARRRAEHIHACLGSPFEIQDSELVVTTSIGVALSVTTKPTEGAEALVRDADTAMYQAKEAGRDTVTVFDASIRDRIADRLALEHDLKLAIEREEFRLAYQPMVTLGEMGTLVVGVEALLRWDRPTRGLVPPSVFVSTAESSGLMLEIGEWVIREACRQLAQWRSVPGAESLFVSVNVSALQMKNASLSSKLRGALSESGIPPNALCIELTESVLSEHPAEGASFLLKLKQIGVRLAIDDFGTGYSSLAYLRQFPVDYVKIDHSFIDGLLNADPADETLVAAVVSMAQALDVVTIAEGVEDEMQEESLRSLEVDLAQGYLYSRPVPGDKVMDVVRALSPRRGLRLVIGDGGVGQPKR